jgi:hypothetical protein
MHDQPPRQERFRLAAQSALGDDPAHHSAQLVVIAGPIIGLMIDDSLGDTRKQYLRDFI